MAVPGPIPSRKPLLRDGNPAAGTCEALARRLTATLVQDGDSNPAPNIFQAPGKFPQLGHLTSHRHASGVAGGGFVDNEGLSISRRRTRFHGLAALLEYGYNARRHSRRPSILVTSHNLERAFGKEPTHEDR